MTTENVAVEQTASKIQQKYAVWAMTVAFALGGLAAFAVGLNVIDDFMAGFWTVVYAAITWLGCWFAALYIKHGLIPKNKPATPYVLSVWAILTWASWAVMLAGVANAIALHWYWAVMFGFTGTLMAAKVVLEFLNMLRDVAFYRQPHNQS